MLLNLLQSWCVVLADHGLLFSKVTDTDLLCSEICLASLEAGWGVKLGSRQMWHEALCSPIHTNVASRAPCGLAGSRMVLSSSTHNPHNSDRGSIIIIIIMFYPPFKHYSGVRWQHLTPSVQFNPLIAYAATSVSDQLEGLQLMNYQVGFWN